MPLTPIFHPQEDWYQAMVTKNKGSLKATNRQEEWYEEIVDSMASGGLPDTTSASFGDVLTLNNSKEAVWTTPSSGGGVLVVHLGDGNALDKTWAEIDAVDVAVIVLRRSENGATVHLREIVTATTIDSDGKYYVEAGDHLTFQTNTADGYPTLGQ